MYSLNSSTVLDSHAWKIYTRQIEETDWLLDGYMPLNNSSIKFRINLLGTTEPYRIGGYLHHINITINTAI